MIEGARLVGPHYAVPVTIAFLVGLALLVLLDIVVTRPRHPVAPVPRRPDRISVDLRRRS